jgi:hypothetical protein
MGINRTATHKCEWRTTKMFKKLAEMISEIKTENDRDATFWQIDREFEQEKISAADYELLYKLAGMVEIEED